jgi:hypothetical protein
MTINLDIAAILSAIFWPVVALTILLAYRQRIPAWVEGVASRVTKLEFAGVSLELAVAKPFIPEWSGAPGAPDLQHRATAIQVNDSTARTFLTQLTEEGTADYAQVDLGTGEEWLTSWLFILAIVFARMKGIKCFVFVETSAGVRKRYVGWTESEKIRWALAKRYPWFEQGYTDAHSTITSQQNALIVSSDGRLGYQFAPGDPGPSIELIREFLQRIQAPPLPFPVPSDPDWVLLDSASNTYEHAAWISGEQLEEILGGDLNPSMIRSAELRSKNTSEQLRICLSVPATFVAVTTEEQRFDYIVDRRVLLEQVAKRLSSETEGRS